MNLYITWITFLSIINPGPSYPVTFKYQYSFLFYSCTFGKTENGPRRFFADITYVQRSFRFRATLLVLLRCVCFFSPVQKSRSERQTTKRTFVVVFRIQRAHSDGQFFFYVYIFRVVSIITGIFPAFVFLRND